MHPSVAMKNSRYIRIAETSDQHAGHSKTPTERVLAALQTAFPNNETTAALDLIIFAGDFFDHLLDLDDEDVYEIRFYIVNFLRMCKQLNIVVRVLKGTPSHDWNQSKLFIHLNKLANINADVRYVDQLSIEYIEALQLNVLYIPDEWRTTCEETWSCVTTTLAEHGLTQVDFVVMHGMFPHQMPEQIHDRLNMHNSEQFLSICKYFIFVGHIHLFSQYYRILSSGSIQRLGHNEEGPKGHIRVNVDTLHGQHEINFIENKDAQIYRTLDLSDMSHNDAMSFIESRVKTLPSQSHVRIRCKRGDAALSLLSQFARAYPLLHWSTVEKKTATRDSPIQIDRQTIKTGIQLTPDNLKPLLMKRIRANSPLVADRCEQLLNEVLNE